MSSYWLYLYLNMMYFLLVIVGMLLAVAFFTLFERKFLSYFHHRKGPNKSMIIGLSQPFADALKLLSKEFMYSPKTSYSVYIISPLVMMSLSIILWMIFPSDNNCFYLNYSIILMFCCLSMSVFPIIMAGWSSNSSYAILGMMRGLAQTISYEVSLAIIIISPLIYCETLNFNNLNEYQDGMNFGWWWWGTSTMLYISSMVEVNRAPFDFIEGESELVSGFNVEYYGFGFAFIFLAEYSMIIWMSGLNCIMFYPFYSLIPMTLYYSYTMIWIRASLPRMRYDELMYMFWKMFLPCSIVTLSSSVLFKYLCTLNI